MIEGMVFGAVVALAIWCLLLWVRDKVRANKHKATREAEDLAEFVKPPAPFTWGDREHR